MNFKNTGYSIPMAIKSVEVDPMLTYPPNWINGNESIKINR